MAVKKVLIIDDDEDIRYTIREICLSQGWKVLEAENFAKAQRVLAAVSPDVILVDYHMPQVDGIAAVREIRKTNRLSSIIVLTIEERDSVVQRFFEAGADDYALKPVKAPDLIARINMHFKYSEHKRYFSDAKKGVNEKTLRLLVDYLRGARSFVDIETMEAALPLTQKTLYRYLQYLQENDRLTLRSEYGKVGRPKTYYKLNTFED